MKYLLLRQPMKHLTAKGFSLLEITVVLTLIALLVTFTLYNFDFFTRNALHAEAEKIAALIRTSRMSALATHRLISLTINIQHNTLCTLQYQEHIRKGIHIGVIPNSFGPPSRPEQPLTSACTFAHNTIIFYPDGTVTPGTLYITDTHKRYMYAITCPIAHTFYLRIYSYEQRRWHLR